MKKYIILLLNLLLLAAWAGCPLEVMAQQANTTVSRTTVAKDKEPDSVK
jgi:predicted small lipoprotein YifL